MDEAGAYRKLHPLAQKRQTVGKDVVDEILAKICRIPRQTVESSETRKLALLEKRLASQVFGQEEAVKEVANAIKFPGPGFWILENPWPASFSSGLPAWERRKLPELLRRSWGSVCSALT